MADNVASYARMQNLVRQAAAGMVGSLLPGDNNQNDILWDITASAPTVPVGKNFYNPETDGPFIYEWEVLNQRGGRVSGGSWDGNTQLVMGANNNLVMGQASDVTYLDPRHTPRRSYLKLQQNVKRLRGQLTGNINDILAELVAKPIEDVAADHIEDAVHHIRKTITCGCYSDGWGVMVSHRSGET